MAKGKAIIIVSVCLILLVLVVGGIYFFMKTSNEGFGKITTTSKDGSTSMSATFYDSNGNPINSGLAQTMIGGNAPSISFMSLLLKVKYTTGNADLSDLRLGTISTPLSENLVGDALKITSLAKTQTTFVDLIDTKKVCTIQADCGTKESCVGTTTKYCLINLTNYESANVGVANPITFSTTIKYNISDAYGNPTTFESTSVTLTYDLRGEACVGGTKYLTCDATKPKYCTNTTATNAPTLVDRASICGCPIGKHDSGDTCVMDTCNDPASTLVNTCQLSPQTSLIGNPNANKRWCNASATSLIEDCRGVDRIAGNGDDCGCATDYNSGVGTCSSTGICNYATYSGGLSGCIPDCVGKATGVSDGCGGTC